MRIAIPICVYKSLWRSKDKKCESISHQDIKYSYSRSPKLLTVHQPCSHFWCLEKTLFQWRNHWVTEGHQNSSNTSLCCRLLPCPGCCDRAFEKVAVRSQQERVLEETNLHQSLPYTAGSQRCCQDQPSPARNSRIGVIVLQRSHCSEINRDVLKYLYMSILVSEQSRSKRVDPHSRLNSWGWR